jgi:hypothetical protein
LGTYDCCYNRNDFLFQKEKVDIKREGLDQKAFS